MEQRYDVLVIGAGPGGYPAAIRAAQRGMSVALVERDALGGVCLNVGCIPSKAMLKDAESARLVSSGSQLAGTGQFKRDGYLDAVRRRTEVVGQLLDGLQKLLKSNNVHIILGWARLDSAHSCLIQSAEGSTHVAFDNLIVATGSSPASLPIPGADLPEVIDSNGALELRTPPARAIIIGGGAIGVEWADIWSAFGSLVTILEMMPTLVPTEEPEIARELARAFSRKGIVSHTGAQVREIRRGSGGVEVVARIGEEDQVIEGDIVLSAVGRRPNIADLGLEVAAVAHDGRGIRTDGFMRTSVPNIYAIGDVTGASLLAHAATHQAAIAVDTIAGQPCEPFDASVVPSAIFTTPEIASVGLTESMARDQGIASLVARFPFLAGGRAVAAGEPAGFVKIVADQSSHAILGAHIVGGPAGDLIGEASLALRMGATLEDLASTIHVHPTFSEALLEAAWVGLGTPLHVPPRTRRPQATSESS